MDGLTNIIAKIEEQNNAECSAIIREAENKAVEIIAAAEKNAADVSRKIAADAEGKARIISLKAESSSELEYKRALLSKKSELIDSCISASLEQICACEDEVYFCYIEKLLLSGAVDGEGVVFFNAKDLARLPAGFCNKINSQLGDGKKLKISDKTVSCMGGCVIEYPEMRIDCTFESLVSDKMEDIRDEINRALFS